MPDADPRDAALDALRALAHTAGARAHVPYSGRMEGAALLLADGTWIPGARVENASFPLTIPAAATAVAAARVRGLGADVRALAFTHPLAPGEAASIAAALADVLGPDVLHLIAPDVLAVEGSLPLPTSERDLTLEAPFPADDTAGVGLATDAARSAHIPYSHFPVGAVLEADDGRLFWGANVEHDDWTRGLCAERVALATAISAGARAFQRLWVACPLSPGGTPCGACRQVLVELALDPDTSNVVIARGDDAPGVTTPGALLPGAFLGERLRA